MGTQASTYTTTANINVKGTYKKALFNGAMAVLVATSGTSFVGHYVAKPIKVKAAAQSPDKKISYMKKTSLAYTQPKRKAKAFVISNASKGAKIAMIDNTNDDNMLSSELATFPIKFGGKLPVRPEDNYTLSYDREYVDVSHITKKVTKKVKIGGSLPVGRER